MGKGIEFYDGAQSVDGGVSSAIPDQPSTRSGGPIVTFDGGFDGHSMAVPTNPSNSIGDLGGKGKVSMDSPINE